MNNSDLYNEVLDHLYSKRFKLALITSKKLLDQNPNDPEANALYAFSLLENLNPFLALDIINYSVELSSNSPESRLKRAEILYRLSIFSGALIDVDFFLANSNDEKSDGLLLKSKILSSDERFFEALEILEELKDKIDRDEYNVFSKLLKFSLDYPEFSLQETIIKNNIIKLCNEAIAKGHFWFPIYIWKNFRNEIKDTEVRDHIRLFNFISLVASFRIKEANSEQDFISSLFPDNNEFIEAQKRLQTINKFIQSDEKTSGLQKVISKTELIKKNENETEVISARFFDLADSISSGKRKYLIQFDENNITYIAVELLLKNYFFGIENKVIKGTAIWYLNENETGRNNFELELNKNWEIIEFVQSWGTELPGFWKSGEGKVEILFDNKIICSRKFLIGDSEIVNLEDSPEDLFLPKSFKSETNQPQAINLYKSHLTSESYSLENLLQELYEFIGLDNLKQSLVDFLTYLNFINERKKKGMKTDEKLELHCLFLGNPGTGKTSVARLLGKILKSMGVLENGHIIEVDRSSLVGQYIGETAIKTDKIISQALGGILFIDEAYSLKKPDSGSDFGQEAIDILLKRMEDHKGSFVVIAAGYPGLMQKFIESNPGLKSRFTHTFYFDDYTPEQLLKIFKLFALREDYEITSDAESYLINELTKVYKNRDESFGNARLIKKIFNESKIQLSKRYQTVTDDFKNNFPLNLLELDDIRKSIEKHFDYINNTQPQFTQTDKILENINKLIGLDNFKREMNDLVKLAKYYSEEGENLNEKLNQHYFFIGNEAAGQKTALKFLTKLLYALRIIQKEEILEVDSSQFLSDNLSEAVEKTNKIFDRIHGGVLYIKKFDAILTEDNHIKNLLAGFVDTLILRLQRDKGFVIVIAEISPTFIKRLPQQYSIINSLFSKSIHFEDYTPDEMTELLIDLLDEKNLVLSDECKEHFKKFFYHTYRNKEKYPPNSLLLKNIIEKLQRNHLLKIAEVPREKRSKELSRNITLDEIKQITETEKSKESSSDDSNFPSLRKHLDSLDKLVGLDEVKQTINRIIYSEKVAAIRKSRGLNVIPRSLNGCFIGKAGTGKSTVSKIFANILFEINHLKSNEVIEINRTTLKNFTGKDLSDGISNFFKLPEGRLILIEDISQLKLSNESLYKDFINNLIITLNHQPTKYVFIISDDSNGIESLFNEFPEMKPFFQNIFYFNSFNPRQMLEIALNFTQEYGYQLDEGAWQLLLDIFSDLCMRDESNGNAKTVLNLIHKAITIQEQRLGLKDSVTDEELNTITIEDIAKLV